MVMPTGKRPAHIYHTQPLDVARTEIRLLHILPAESDDETIDCTFEIISLTSRNSPFMALSYVWGDASVLENIIVQGEVFPVTTNLRAALLRLRGLGATDSKLIRGLWVDALCVNQDDIPERNSQVKLMSTLYERAQIVYGWLGPEENDSSYAIDMIGKLIANMPQQYRNEGLTDWIIDWDKAGYQWLEQVSELWTLSLDPGVGLDRPNRALAALTAFFRREYWKRVWILQEVILSTNIQFLCGHREVAWLEVSLVSSILDSVTDLPIDRWTFCERENPERRRFIAAHLSTYTDSKAFIWAQRRRRLMSPDPIELYEIARLIFSYHCTDPRDKLYGLLAISSSSLVADYSESNTKSKVYREFAVEMLRVYRGLENIFTHPNEALLGPSTRNSDILPSWVPDWMAETGRFSVESWFRASADREPLGFTQCVTNSIISTFGIHYGQVTKITRRFTSKDTFITYKLLAEVAEYLIHHRDKYPSGISQLQAMVRLLQADKFFKPTVNWESDEFFYWVTGFIYTTIDAIITVNRVSAEQAAKKMSAILGDLDGRKPLMQAFLDEFFGAPTTSHQVEKCKIVLSTTVSHFRYYRFLKLMWDKSLFSTDKGHLGLAPNTIENGDSVFVPNGCRFPIIIRKVDRHYIFVGPSFVQGLMEGEAVEAEENGRATVKLIEFH